MSARLAPALILRAAAWPESALAPFGDAELGSLARTLAGPRPGRRDREAHHARRALERAFEARYREVLERDAARLVEATVASPRFVHALWLSNPALAARLAEGPPPTLDSKRERHLLTTLFRYLSRAAGRATPCDLWSSVSLVTLGPETRRARVRARAALAPDLRPFQLMLRELAARPEYVARERLAPSPTLCRHADGTWTTWLRGPHGFATPRALGSHPVAGRILERAQAAPRPLRGAELEANDRDVLRALVDHGFLVGGLELPARFRSPWQALARAKRRLLPLHRDAWARAVSALGVLAEALGAFPRDDEPRSALDARMRASLDAAQEILRELARALEVELEIPRAVFRADLTGAWSLVLGPAEAASLSRSVDAYAVLQRELGLGLAFRAAARERAAARVADGLALTTLEPRDAALPMPAEAVTWDAVARLEGGSPALDERVERWSALVASDERELSWTPSGTAAPVASVPLGVLMLQPHARGGALEPWIQGVLDDPTGVHGRFAWSLSERGDPLERWLSTRLRATARGAGLDAFELAMPPASQPNVSAHPAYLRRAVEPWSAGGSRRALRGLRVEARGSLLYATSPRWPRPFVVAHVTAAHTLGDPIARALLATTFRDAPLHSVQASTVPFERELGRSRPTPLLRLADGSVGRAARWVLEGEPLRALIEPSGAARFLAWQALCAQGELPARLVIRRDGEPPVTLLRDSPLSLEAILEGARERTKRVMIELPPDSPPWLEDADGERYVAELAVPFENDAHAWSITADPS